MFETRPSGGSTYKSFQRVPPPPNRTKFFRFYICFHRKASVLEVGAPSSEGWHPPPPPNGKSWIRPCRPIGVLCLGWIIFKWNLSVMDILCDAYDKIGLKLCFRWQIYIYLLGPSILISRWCLKKKEYLFSRGRID